MIELLKAKIHRATVTDANLYYEGSITIYGELLDASNIHEYEKVTVVNTNNGQRFDTYVIRGDNKENSICVNGAAARLVSIGDKVIIMAYSYYEESFVRGYLPQIVTVDDQNNIKIADVLN